MPCPITCSTTAVAVAELGTAPGMVFERALTCLTAATRFSRALLEALQVSSPMLVKDLEDAIEAVIMSIRPWATRSMWRVGPLQEAARNQGRVYHMEDRTEGGCALAVKRMPNTWVCANPADFAKCHPSSGERPWHDLGYIRYLNDIGFPYVCKLHGVYRDSAETFVATSLCSEGDLFSWFDNPAVPRSGLDREVYMRPIVIQLLNAVRWLHNLGVAHRDLSLENILLTCDWRGRPSVRLCDFGMATLSRHARREIRGKLPYQAPEMHVDIDYDTLSADNFALGVLLFAMAAEDYPWTSTRTSECQLFEYVSAFGLRRFLEKRMLRKGNGERLIEVFSAAFAELVEALIQVTPSARACLGELRLATSGVCSVGRPLSVWDLSWLRGAVSL